MNNIENYQLEDFVQDLFFRRWVLGKNSSDNQFWENWIRANPEKEALIEEAKSLVIATQIEEIEISREKIEEGIAKILLNTKSRTKKIYEQNWVKIAASIALTILFSWAYFPSDSFKSSPFSKLTETENNSSQPLTLKLNDGSTVTLMKGSKLQVSAEFSSQNRKVTLTGEALFEVKKDPLHPFLVYAGGIVTKVLGTSFNVRAYKNEPNTLVAVRTGRVTVYQEPNSKVRNQTHSEQILLAPNQQVIFEKIEKKLVKTLVEDPVILMPNTGNSNFDYEETPIPRVLEQFEKSYGVKIIFDAELLSNCNLTASFNNENLFEKMDIICETIQARYEIADGQIVIYSKGCK